MSLKVSTKTKIKVQNAVKKLKANGNRYNGNVKKTNS